VLDRERGEVGVGCEVAGGAEGKQKLAQDGCVALGGVDDGDAWLVEPAFDELDRGVHPKRALEHDRARARAPPYGGGMRCGDPGWRGLRSRVGRFGRVRRRTALAAGLMRAIHVARLDKARPVLILTRELVRPHMTSVTVAPITTTVRGLSTEVPVGKENGLEGPAVVSCENITTIPTGTLGRQIGGLLDHQELALGNAILAAFDLG